MTVINLQVATGLGDISQEGNGDNAGRVVTASSIITNSAILAPGSHNTNDEYCVGVRFPGVTIPQGSTISSATFQLNANATYNAGANVVKFYVSCEASDDAPALTTGNGDLRSTTRPRTTAFSTWTQTSVVVSTWYSVDITSAVQEIINRAGWVSGNAIVVLIDTHEDCTTGEWQDYNSYDGSPSSAPKLDIDYVGAGGGQPFSLRLKSIPGMGRGFTGHFGVR